MKPQKGAGSSARDREEKKEVIQSSALKKEQGGPHWQGGRTYLNLGQRCRVGKDMIHWGKGPYIWQI